MNAKSWLIILTSLVSPSAYASTQAHLVQLVQQAPTVTSIQSPGGSAALATTRAALVIQVVSASGLVVPDGSVAVSDGSTILGSATIISGTANITESFLSLGVHHLIACYSGDANFAPSCSSPTSLDTVAPYTLQQTNSSVTIEGSIAFTDKLSIIPAKGFVGVVQLACQVPANSCRLSPSSVSFSGNGKPLVVEASFIPSPSPPTASFIALPLIGIIGFQINRKHNQSRLLAFLLTATLLLGLTGCGPFVAIPFNSANFAMSVKATSGGYSQAVMYQIQIDTDIAKQ